MPEYPTNHSLRSLCRGAPMSETRAGTPAQPSDLVDVPHLVTSYYTGVPDPEDVDQQVAFGTSGHRGTSLKTSFNETHILATTQAICDYRKEQGYDGPLFMGRDTHGLSEPAWASALEVLVANDVTVLVDDRDGYTPTPAVSHAIIRANRRQVAAGWPTGSWSPRRTTRRPTAGSSTTRPTAAPPTPTRRRDRGARQRPDQGRARRRAAHAVHPGAEGGGGLRLPRHLRRRPAGGPRHRRDPRRPASGSAPTRSGEPASPTGARSPSGTGSTSRWSTRWSTPPGGS